MFPTLPLSRSAAKKRGRSHSRLLTTLRLAPEITRFVPRLSGVVFWNTLAGQVTGFLTPFVSKTVFCVTELPTDKRKPVPTFAHKVLYFTVLPGPADRPILEVLFPLARIKRVANAARGRQVPRTYGYFFAPPAIGPYHLHQATDRYLYYGRSGRSQPHCHNHLKKYPWQVRVLFH